MMKELETQTPSCSQVQVQEAILQSSDDEFQTTTEYLDSPSGRHVYSFFQDEETIGRALSTNNVPLLVFLDEQNEQQSFSNSDLRFLALEKYGQQEEKEFIARLTNMLRCKDQELENRSFNFKRPLLHQNYEDGLLFLNQTEMTSHLKKIIYDAEKSLQDDVVETSLLFHEGLLLQIDFLNLPIGAMLIQKDASEALYKEKAKQALAKIHTLIRENRMQLLFTLSHIQGLGLTIPKNNKDAILTLKAQKLSLKDKEGDIFLFGNSAINYVTKGKSVHFISAKDLDDSAPTLWGNDLLETVSSIFHHGRNFKEGYFFILFTLSFSNEKAFVKLVKELTPNTKEKFFIRNFIRGLNDTQLFQQQSKILSQEEALLLPKSALMCSDVRDRKAYIEMLKMVVEMQQRTTLWFYKTPTLIFENVKYQFLKASNIQFEGDFTVFSLKQAVRNNFKFKSHLRIRFEAHNQKTRETVSNILQNNFYISRTGILLAEEYCFMIQEDRLRKNLCFLKEGKPLRNSVHFCDGCILTVNPFDVVLAIFDLQSNKETAKETVLRLSSSVKRFFLHNGFRKGLEEALQLPLGEGQILKTPIVISIVSQDKKTTSTKERFFRYFDLNTCSCIRPTSSFSIEDFNNKPFILGSREIETKGMVVFAFSFCQMETLKCYAKNNSLCQQIEIQVLNNEKEKILSVQRMLEKNYSEKELDKFLEEQKAINKRKHNTEEIETTEQAKAKKIKTIL